MSPPETLVVKGGTTWAINGQWILPENARLPRNIQGSFTCRKSTTWGKRLYFPSEGRRAEDFFALKNPTASAGFEPANLGTKGQHATTRPPKPQWIRKETAMENPGWLLTFVSRTWGKAHKMCVRSPQRYRSQNLVGDGAQTVRRRNMSIKRSNRRHTILDRKVASIPKFNLLLIRHWSRPHPNKSSQHPPSLSPGGVKRPERGVDHPPHPAPRAIRLILPPDLRGLF